MLATVTFYQKPGCATNGRQKRMLEAKGHTVVARSLLAEPWTAEHLLGFFAGTPVASWFNRASPRVKSGEITPDHIDAATALALMIHDPLLIRRPLVDSAGVRCAGFDPEPVISLLGGAADRDDEACSRPSTSTRCRAPHQA